MCGWIPSSTVERIEVEAGFEYSCCQRLNVVCVVVVGFYDLRLLRLNVGFYDIQLAVRVGVSPGLAWLVLLLLAGLTSCEDRSI